MTCKKETVLVLMDSDMHLLKQGVKAVNAAQPVTELVPPQENQQKTLSVTSFDHLWFYKAGVLINAIMNHNFTKP